MRLNIAAIALSLIALFGVLIQRHENVVYAQASTVSGMFSVPGIGATACAGVQLAPIGTTLYCTAGDQQYMSVSGAAYVAYGGTAAATAKVSINGVTGATNTFTITIPVPTVTGSGSTMTISQGVPVITGK